MLCLKEKNLGSKKFNMYVNYIDTIPYIISTKPVSDEKEEKIIEFKKFSRFVLPMILALQ